MSFFDFEALDESARGSAAPEELASRLVEQTPSLTPGERAALLEAALESQRTSSGARTTATSRASSGTSSTSRPRTGGSTGAQSGRPPSAGGTRTTGAGAGARGASTSASRPAAQQQRSRDGGSRFDFGDIGRFVQQGFDVAQQGAQIFSAFSGIGQQQGSPGAAPRPDVPAAPPPGPGGDLPHPAAAPQPGPPPAFGGLPGPYAQLGTFGGLGAAAQGQLPLAALWQALQAGQVPPLPGAHAPAPTAAAPTLDATALLGLLLRNPQLQQATQAAAAFGAAGPRSVTLPVPALSGARQTSIPLGAVMNAIALLASRSMEELNALTGPEDPDVPEYLVSEAGEFLVDPASPEERAALVTHLFRLSEEAGRAGAFPQSDESLDEAEAWARDAGFDL